MVIGSDITTVQYISRYCLQLGADVFPYYGTPPDEDVDLFGPDVLILCLPLPEDFLQQVDLPYILWSNQAVGQPLVSTLQELEARLKAILSD